MGLAAPKRRLKLSHDPNNTGWSNAADSYGQKILAAQGWKPGDYLGAQDASHAEHYTAANKAHIKILLREDNLGLGAQVGKSNAETFGLSLYSGVLSRLNGKSDAEVEKQQNAMRDAELRTYQHNKFGFMNFVSGGVLVGDSMKPAEVRKTKDASAAEVSERGAKRRKLSSGDEDKHSRTMEAPLEIPSDPKPSMRESEEVAIAKKKSRKAKKSRDSPELEDSTQFDKKLLKEQKRARKEERRKRKEEKRRKKDERRASSSQDAPQTQSGEEAAKTDAAAKAGGRHAVRHRYIHQKRMASMDPRAMREIFMVTGSA